MVAIEIRSEGRLFRKINLYRDVFFLSIRNILYFISESTCLRYKNLWLENYLGRKICIFITSLELVFQACKKC